jgi:hypothetical protein
MSDSGEQVGQTAQSLTVGGCSDQTFPLFRYYNPSVVDHFYTTNFGELGGGALGYGFEGIQCYVAP